MTIDPPGSTRLFDRGSPVPAALANVDPGFVDRLARISGLDVREIPRRLLRPGPPVVVPILALGSQHVRLRPASSDVRVLDLTFSRHYHLPPRSSGHPQLVLDLGANIGLTMAHFAHLFRGAHVVGVEMDSANAALCRANVAPRSRRCSVVEAAIFAQAGQAPYRPLPGDEWAHHLGDVRPGEGELVWVPTLTLDMLLDSIAPRRRVDFMKVDVEGTERDLFRAGGSWVDRVECLAVETHEPYSAHECADDLARLGFEAAVDERHWGQSVIAFRAGGGRRGRS
jgi:FkbM family methyltransferase